ncbi:DUF4258 domain-containing protein [Polaribacter sp.]|jgi:hypothetical protein|nr:DUF4258 domain-containing protein [Polaribacter sp.]MDA9348438.1 DUF4258 domain-containing protein [Polaribacter sp.]MDA9362596.1 DUF4258 domain-containing protein [Polaribacter sp.]MDA9976908.1 DUF4258 domain-containing protein [Polaribacter sp.]MDB0026321.1 DUF4258 domain-containing protein [Polaribacter sp.]
MLVKRIFYYLVGLSLGSIAVYFFWQKKNASFDYGMDARTLKTIRIRERLFSEEAKLSMQQHRIDTTMIATILYLGDVNFNKSNQWKKPCGEYYITGSKTLENIHLLVKRCDSTATIEKIMIH